MLRATLVILVLLYPAAGVAQSRPRVGSLPARMRALFSAMEDYSPDALVGFFPAHGDWTWIVTTHNRDGSDSIARRSFTPAELRGALARSGPLCRTFTLGADLIPMGAIGYHVLMTPGRWRQVGASRLVPPRALATSPVFLEWRREDGRWVLSQVGIEEDAAPHVLGTMINSVQRGTSVPGDSALTAERAAWSSDHEAVHLDGRTFIAYGLPRELPPDVLERVGSLNGVSVYVERGTAEHPDWLYIPAGGGRFAPYQDNMSDGCRG